ncbi:DNA cytosine methyltransferase [Rhizobium leguminosarum]|nr:DNA cytosine methyltransferase [Rhizobium leguminosarum]
MNSKAETLAAAKKRIIELQSQMTDRILKMAAEVERLLEVVTEREAREFLRVGCNVPSSELSTYVRFQERLKGSETLLTRSRISFPVLKSLVGCDLETRQEILERMEIGARVDTKEIAAIRKRLRDAKLTPGQLVARKNGALATAAARRQGEAAAKEFKDRLHAFVSIIINTTDAVHIVSDEVRSEAGELRREFESLFGSDHRPPEELKSASPAYQLSIAHLALEHLEEGTLDGAAGITPRRDERHPWIVALQSLTGRALPEFKKEMTALRQTPPPHDRLKVVELCAGAGGMSIGLERAGYKHVALVEFDKHAAATLRRNRPGWNVIQDDIRSIDFKIIQQLDIDLVCGGLPCQPYSSDGYGLGKEDPRDLWLEGVRVVSEIKPRAFVFENVDGFLHGRHADHVADILRRFRKAGYQVDIHRMQAEDFGIAQERSRILVIGLRDEFAGAFRMPSGFPERRTNIGDALVDLMATNGWLGACEWASARREQPRFGRDGKVAGYGALASTIMTRRGKPRDKEAARWGSKDVDIAGLPDHAPTAEQAAKPGFMPALTARMRARLQNFPDDWEFQGGKQATADQIGNAVPPRMAQAVGLAIFAALKDVTWDMEAMLWPEESHRMIVSAPKLAIQDAHHIASVERVDELDL